MKETREILRIGTSPPLAAVMSHFNLLIEVFLSEESTSNLIKWADRISRQVYEFLDKSLKTTDPMSEESAVLTFAQEHCIWTGETFIMATCVAVEWN